MPNMVVKMCEICNGVLATIKQPGDRRYFCSICFMLVVR